MTGKMIGPPKEYVNKRTVLRVEVESDVRYARGITNSLLFVGFAENHSPLRWLLVVWFPAKERKHGDRGTTFQLICCIVCGIALPCSLSL